MELREGIAEVFRRYGACGAAVTPVGVVADEVYEGYRRWLEEGNAAGMEYLGNHMKIRREPRLLLEDGESIICCAFDFSAKEKREERLPLIATYAYGDDYHEVIRRRLADAINIIKAQDPEVAGKAEYRICVDTAPIMERYWAERSGLGKRLDNGMIAIPGVTATCFLAEIITTLPITYLSSDSKERDKENPCLHCGRCMAACPGGALKVGGYIDSRRCVSYLTIEHKGEFSEGEKAILKKREGGYLFGCDACLEACPLTTEYSGRAVRIEEFGLRGVLRELTREEILGMDSATFSKIFKGSAIKRAKLRGLQRNCR